MSLFFKLAAWCVALAWTARTIPAAFGLPRIADLLGPDYDREPEGLPSLAVIVPGRNEQADVGACLQSLLDQDYAPLEIIAVNDRSSDQTGAIMERLASASSGCLRVLHVIDLPAGWLGKTHAMALAARSTDADFLLFTDADIFFRTDALRRSLAFAVNAGADHLVTVPTPIQKRWDESALLGLFQIFGLLGIRAWRVDDPRAKRDAIGIGAFNLLRRSAYETVGGFEALRMEIVEDIGMGRRVKRAGLRQRVAFGRGLVRVHWASGSLGLVHVMTKNMFSAVGFHVSLLLGVCTWLIAFCLAPFFAIAIPGLRAPAAVSLGSLALCYHLTARHSGISAWNVLLTPFAAVLLLYALLRSMVITLHQGGVVWRGTFYDLAELRKNAAPLL